MKEKRRPSIFLLSLLSLQVVETLSALVGVDASLVVSMLTQRVVKARVGESFTKQLTVQEATLTRDAIVKSLYEVNQSFGAAFL